MKKIRRRNSYFFFGGIHRAFFGAGSRRGASGFAMLIFASVFAVVSISIVSLKFSEKSNSVSEKGFLPRISATILKTFGDIFSPKDKRPVLEIDLSKNSDGGFEEKNNGIFT